MFRSDGRLVGAAVRITGKDIQLLGNTALLGSEPSESAIRQAHGGEFNRFSIKLLTSDFRISLFIEEKFSIILPVKGEVLSADTCDCLNVLKMADRHFRRKMRYSCSRYSS